MNSASEAQKAVDIAEAFVGAGDGDLSGRGAVINSLTIEEQDQVMLRVAVVEISRTVLKELGIQTNAGWSTSMNPLPSNLRFDTTGGGTSLSGGFGGSGFDIDVTLNAMENAGLSRTLAEPTLVTVSGEGASFMAGGEIPILQPCPSGATNCTPSVNFKPFGINLAFTPVVLVGEPDIASRRNGSLRTRFRNRRPDRQRDNSRHARAQIRNQCRTALRCRDDDGGADQQPDHPGHRRHAGPDEHPGPRRPVPLA